MFHMITATWTKTNSTLCMFTSEIPASGTMATAPVNKSVRESGLLATPPPPQHKHTHNLISIGLELEQDMTSLILEHPVPTYCSVESG